MTTELIRADRLADPPSPEVDGQIAASPTPAPPAGGSRPLRRWSVGELIVRALAARPAEGRC